MSRVTNPQARIAALLDAVAEEIALTAREIAELGQIVFTDNTIGDRHTRLRKLDAFHLLQEKCDASAQLVQALAFAVDAPVHDHLGLLAEAVSTVPFHQMRERLETALNETSRPLPLLEQIPATY
ncbi:MAG: hypothetical protein ABSA49_13750 [Rhizomicrobium sp.]|jgi:hypothetical protein